MAKDHSCHRAKLLFVLMATHSLWIRTQAEPLLPISDYRAISGRWSGIETVNQRGACSINKSKRLEESVSFILDVGADGSLVGTLTFPSVTGGREVRGQIDRKGTFKAEESNEATCNDEERRYTVSLVGKIVDRNGRYQLEMKGLASPCPPKCLFEVRYRLDKIDPVSEGRPMTHTQ